MGINDPGRGRPACAADGDRGGAGRAGEGAQERTTVSQLGHAGDLCAKVQKCKGGTPAKRVRGQVDTVTRGHARSAREGARGTVTSGQGVSIGGTEARRPSGPE